MTLRRNLAHLQASEAQAAFGLADWLPQWQKTIANYQVGLSRILSLLKPTMQVETRVEETPPA